MVCVIDLSFISNLASFHLGGPIKPEALLEHP